MTQLYQYDTPHDETPPDHTGTVQNAISLYFTTTRLGGTIRCLYLIALYNTWPLLYYTIYHTLPHTTFTTLDSTVQSRHYIP